MRGAMFRAGSNLWSGAVDSHPFIPLDAAEPAADAELERRARAFAARLSRRRTVRDYSPRPVPRAVVEHCLRAAGSAPSGANRQPWHFVVVTDPALKRRIREAAEVEERDFYENRAPAEWLAALAPLGTGPDKPFLEGAPLLIAIFARSYDVADDGSRSKNYYVTESVGIATGMLITALHEAGLATLTHTPSPMGFLNRVLCRPAHERPFLLLVAGFPAPGATVPDIARKPLPEIATFLEPGAAG
jgi:iodotyrosine deiodinase